jgi:hypothetical protein
MFSPCLENKEKETYEKCASPTVRAHASIYTNLRSLETDSEAFQLNYGTTTVFVDRFNW